jgi:hypothetical protein
VAAKEGRSYCEGVGTKERCSKMAFVRPLQIVSDSLPISSCLSTRVTDHAWYKQPLFLGDLLFALVFGSGVNIAGRFLDKKKPKYDWEH